MHSSVHFLLISCLVSCKVCAGTVSADGIQRCKESWPSWISLVTLNEELEISKL